MLLALYLPCPTVLKPGSGSAIAAEMLINLASRLGGGPYLVVSLTYLSTVLGSCLNRQMRDRTDEATQHATATE